MINYISFNKKIKKNELSNIFYVYFYLFLIIFVYDILAKYFLINA